MDNVFFKFLKDYWQEIVDLFDKLYAWFKDMMTEEE